MKTKALILIGGQSKRFGEEKYLIQANGKSQIEYLHDILSEAGLEVFISCNRAQVPALSSDYEVIVDEWSSIGPIGGIASAFRKSVQSNWLVVACDLIHITSSNILDLLSNQDLSKDVITYRKPESEFLETTFTLYNSSCKKTFLEEIEKRDYKIQNLMNRLDVKEIIPDSDHFLKNVNYPFDLE